MAIADIISQIDNLTVLELHDLVKTLEEKYGVSAAAPVAVDGYRSKHFSIPISLFSLLP